MGKEEGLAEGIISTCKNLQFTEDEIINQLMEILNIEEERARDCVKEYCE